MNTREIMQHLPHRYPLLLVDRVEELEVGKSIRAWKNVSITDAVFLGHFPQYPIYPGVLIIEAMTQAAGILGFKTAGKLPSHGDNYVLAGVDKVRFKNQVKPGDRLILEAELVTHKGNFWKFSCRAKVDDSICCSAQVMCAFVGNDQLS